MGSVTKSIVELLIGVVILFIGLFVILAVSGVMALPGSSPFYTTYQNASSFVGIFFGVMGVVIIIHALATMLKALHTGPEGPGPGPGHGGFG